MTYNSSPLQGQTLAQTRDQIKNNSDLLKSALEVNHVALSSGDAGKHKFCVFPRQSSAPTTSASETALYSKTRSGIETLYFRLASDGTEIPLTNIAPSAATSGYTFLPGGLLMQWGQKASPGNSGSVSFPVAFTAAPYSISVSLQRDSGNQSVTVSSSTAPTATTFNYLSSSSGSSVLYWIAIGPK